MIEARKMFKLFSHFVSDKKRQNIRNNETDEHEC